MNLKCPLILASASPRRKKLLEQLGLSFTVHASHVDEDAPADAPAEHIVQHLSSKKAAAVAPQFADALTLAADTLVVLDGAILGKPADEDEATRMLKRLSGRQHEVYTGIALHHPATSRYLTAFETTRVTFSSLSEREIAAYVATRSPFDKAGGYGIQDDQGALYVSGIEGDYYNVVGLPLNRLYQMLKVHFSDLLMYE